jgi:hypothetical protein
MAAASNYDLAAQVLSCQGKGEMALEEVKRHRRSEEAAEEAKRGEGGEAVHGRLLQAQLLRGDRIRVPLTSSPMEADEAEDEAADAADSIDEKMYCSPITPAVKPAVVLQVAQCPPPPPPPLPDTIQWRLPPRS